MKLYKPICKNLETHTMNATPKAKTTRKPAAKKSVAKPTTVRAWYLKKYPFDTEAKNIRAKVTFNDLFDALICGKDFYRVLGVPDSIIRENIFAEMARQKRVKYDRIYNLWLK